MKKSEEQIKYYERKLEITLFNYFKSFEKNTEENLSKCFRYLENIKEGEDNLPVLIKRKNILAKSLSNSEIEIQKFYLNQDVDLHFKDFYGVKNVINNIIESYDYEMLKKILISNNQNIDLKVLKNLNKVSTELFNEIDPVVINKIFENYIFPDNFQKKISTGLGLNIKAILNGKKDISCLNNSINYISRVLSIKKEKNKLANINNLISNYLTGTDKILNNEIKNRIKDIETIIIEENSDNFLKKYIENINNLKIDVLKFYSKIEEHQNKITIDNDFLNKPIKNDFSENKLLNFINNKLEEVKFKNKLKFKKN